MPVAAALSFLFGVLVALVGDLLGLPLLIVLLVAGAGGVAIGYGVRRRDQRNRTPTSTEGG